MNKTIPGINEQILVKKDAAKQTLNRPDVSMRLL
jgi:hypothetical protein